MKPIYRAVGPEDLNALGQFLQAMFNAPNDFPALRPAQLAWKVLTPRADFDQPRGWVSERGGEMQAAGVVWPLTILTPQADVPGLHVIDWAGNPKAAGAGASMMRFLGKMGQVTCAAGGSEDTRKILPLMGMRPVQALTLWALPIRPLRQALTHQYRDWRLPARLARNSWIHWNAMGGPRWTSSAVPPESLASSLWPRPEPGLAVFKRTPEFFHYLAQCPEATVRLYRATGPNGREGYFCLAKVPGLAKLIDAWTPSANAEDWAALYRAAAHQALEFPDVAEVVTLAGIQRARQALQLCGFRPRGDMELNVANATLAAESGLEFHFQMADNDTGFLHTGRPNYLT